MKKVVVLGSTGFLGQRALEVIKHLASEFQIFGLAAHSNTDLLARQAKRFRPRFVIIGDSTRLTELKQKLGGFLKCAVLTGIAGMTEAVTQPEADIVIVCLSGLDGILPVLAAIEKRKRIAIATKEILVSFGKIVMQRAKKYDAEILPIDSEQVALHQCLAGNNLSLVKRVILTASGGPFWHRKNLNNIKLTEALRHPIWPMGKKITIDSATLMNKGLEVIETVRFWNLPPQKVEVLIHPQSVIHSMVEFLDGSILAQLAVPDMRLPIQYALTYPKRLPSLLAQFDFTKFPNLEFFPPNLKKFACLKLAYQAIEKDNGYPCVLNAANEVAVKAFLQGKLKFSQIPKVISQTLRAYHPPQANSSLTLKQIIATDQWAQSYCLKQITVCSKP
uniref:1-deoxy-D-xylulose 5-phosphate reductoisomerase n=1 Tax=candidate division WOR-3 bacterium TaxID=2052148 RepID=A0A7C6EBD8_UNCW3